MLCRSNVMCWLIRVISSVKKVFHQFLKSAVYWSLKYSTFICICWYIEFNFKPSFTEKTLILHYHENLKEGFLIKDISKIAKDDEDDKLLYKLDKSGEEICTIGQTDGKLKLKIRPDREVRRTYNTESVQNTCVREHYGVVNYYNIFLIWCVLLSFRTL